MNPSAETDSTLCFMLLYLFCFLVPPFPLWAIVWLFSLWNMVVRGLFKLVTFTIEGTFEIYEIQREVFSPLKFLVALS